MISPCSITMDTCSNSKKGFTPKSWSWIRRTKITGQHSSTLKLTLRMGNSTLKLMTNEKHSISKSSTILISLGTYPNDQPVAYTSPKLYVMPRYVTKPMISSTESDYSSTNCAKNISPKNGCWQPWRNVAGRTPELWKNTAIGWTIIWPLIVGALIHEAGTVIQALKPVCQFMAEDIPPPVLNPYPTTSINSTSHKVPSQPSSQD